MEKEAVSVMKIPSRSIREVRKEGGFFQHGVAYTSNSDDKIRYNHSKTKEEMSLMSMNYGMYGQPRPSEFHKKQVEEIIKEQERREKEEKKRQKLNAKVNRFLSKKLIKRIVPTKVKTVFTNLPVITPKNIYKYFRAELSNIEQGPVSLPVYEERKKICGECPKRMFPEGYSDPLGFCTECGCGANPRAQLTVKLKLPATSCPLGKWDEAPGIYEGLWGRIRYIFTRRRSK